MSQNQQVTYVPNSQYPIRFEKLRPGSYFRIDSEPSRRIRKSNDSRIYYKAKDGFFAMHPVTGAGCCLMPQDMVIPMRQVRVGGK